MEQIKFIYFQDYMQYYTVHHKEKSTYMEIWHREWWLKLRPQLPVCFGFTISSAICLANVAVIGKAGMFFIVLFWDTSEVEGLVQGCR